MTEPRVRELLTEVADAVPPPEVAERAWRRSVRVRRRRVAGTAVLAVGVVVAVIGVVAVFNDGSDAIPDGDGRADVVAPPVPESAFPRPPDAHVGKIRAWIGPTIDEEAHLPTARTVVPGSIDLDEDLKTTDTPGRSVAAFAASDAEHQLEEVVLVGRDGLASRLDVSGLDTVTRPDDEGDADTEDEYVLPLNISSLSPDGTRLVLAQNYQVVLYNLLTGHKETYRTGISESYFVGWTETKDGWEVQLVRDLLDPDTGEIQESSYQGDGESQDSEGPTDVWPKREMDGREAFAVADQPVPALGSDDDDILITVKGSPPAMLALPVDGEDHVSPRSRVIGWLGTDYVAFQSQDHGSYRVLGWDTDTGSMRLLSEADLPSDWDSGVTASWADLLP
jgi:hypothetical protein